MMKKKLFHLLTVTAIIIVMLAACSSKKDMDYGTTYDDATYGSVNEESATGLEGNEESKVTNTSSLTSNETNLSEQDKIIRRVNLEVETKDFDNLINSIDAQITQLGGYVEKSNIRGRRYDYMNDMLYGDIVARVPKDKLEEFISTVKDSANVVNEGSDTENVTVEYVNTENHKKALEIEQDRLLALLEKVETLEDIIVLESRLSSVRYELQTYETQLRTYDNLVEYSTVTLAIQEVERMSSLVEEKKNVWNRIHSGFGDTMYDIGEGLKNFLVWFIVNLPYLIIWAVIITAIFFVSRSYYQKSKAKYYKQQHQTTDPDEDITEKKQ